MEAEHKAREERRVLAMGRAEELLRRHLSAEQHNAWKLLGYVPVQKGEALYLLNGTGVKVVKRGHIVAHICIHVYAHVPLPDMVLAQLLLLETSESEFLRIGNVTPQIPAVPWRGAA